MIRIKIAAVTAIEEGTWVESSKLKVASLKPSPEGSTNTTVAATPVIAQAPMQSGKIVIGIG